MSAAEEAQEVEAMRVTKLIMSVAAVCFSFPSGHVNGCRQIEGRSKRAIILAPADAARKDMDAVWVGGAGGGLTVPHVASIPKHASGYRKLASPGCGCTTGSPTISSTAFWTRFAALNSREGRSPERRCRRS